MPRICPLQLLTCLSVLLTPGGGILSGEEVPRLVNLMTKFSKKLVSKCVYILILKSTDTHLVDLFMTEGGWALIHTWLQDAIGISNWDLVKEILSLLIVTPVDVERLKLNNIPKLVKSLSKLKDVPTVQELSSKLVTDWLAIVKSNTRPEEPKVEESIAKIEKVEPVLVTPTVETVDSSQIKVEDSIEEIPASNFYKVTVRDGKQVISRTPLEISELELGKVEVEKLESDKSKSSSVDKKSRSSSSSSKHSSSSRSKSSSSSSSSSSSKHKSSSSKSSSSSSRDRDKDRKDKYKDKHKNGLKHSSNKESKEKQAEKDKDTLAKLKPHSVGKIGRIPKKTGDDKEKDAKETKEVRKSTISIEVRKNAEERPKTVKVFNSKRRSTGLEEEAKPPPPRPVKKPPVPLPATIPLKRSSPIRDVPGTPPEKKLKIDVSVAAAPERPGAIKLIPPKPKPPFLQESDLFMDALAASATTKKEPKKRKRRLSVSKDTPESPTDEKSTPTSPATSPLGLKNIAPINFYQDTLETSEKDADTTTDEKTDESENKDEQMEAEPTVRVNESGLRGVLVVGKRKGPKKSVKFNDSDLTQVRFFELDETERVNVTKTFMDMAKMEMSSEREALFMSRKLPNEDLMGEQIPWRMLYIIDIPEPAVSAGCKSLEKDIQFAREKSTLQTFYFDKRKIPDSPEEPIPENHQMIDPIVIPLDDSETQDIDLRKTPWPEPKGSPPPPVQEPVIPPQMFTNIPMGFQNFPPHAVPPQGFQGMPPRFGPPQPPGMYPGPPNMMGPPNGNMMGPPGMAPPPEMMQHLNPNAFGHGPGPGPGPDNFNPMMGGDNPNFPMPFNGPPNMFPPNNFNMNRGGGGGGGGNRGGFRRGGGGGNNNNGTWMRMPGPGNWNNRGGGGGGGRGGRICKNVQKHGFCRNMDKGCPFIHPK